MDNIKANPIQSEISSEPKSQVTEITGDELLNDEELEAVCGGIKIGPIDISGTIENIIKEGTDTVARIYNAGEGFGRSVSGVVENGDRYC
jgi:hypothetical protein